MWLLVFGTYDAGRHPRVGVLAEGLAASGVTVEECNEPNEVDTSTRVNGISRPWTLVMPGLRILRAWVRLWRRGRRISAVDAVLVGYLGVFDVHLARRLWRKTPVLLDELAFAGDTARDRGVGGKRVRRLLDWLDRKAAQAADVVLVDTDESLTHLPPDLRGRGLVVPVGAPAGWFREPERRVGKPLRVVFFGLYTPLQGAPVIGEAIRAGARADVEWTMIGRGQDLDTVRRMVGDTHGVCWLDWVQPGDLPETVAGHDVCLGIFGTGEKARRVVPNKVYQGAAAGCAIVTSDTAPQRRALGEDALYVPCGDSAALADVIAALAEDRPLVERLRAAAYRRAVDDFAPRSVVAPLVRRLADLASEDRETD